MGDDKTVLRVEMLGGFSIISNGELITEQAKKPSKVWRLVQYLVAHRSRAVSQDELLDIFCSDEGRGNPGSVLRTMVYRARTMLAEGGLSCATEIISAKSGCYSWNNNIECTTDTEEFEELIKKAGAADLGEREKLALLLEATNLYKGDFLQGHAGDMWVIPLVRWYRGLYVNAVHEALDLLMKNERTAEAEELSTKALGIDPFDEYCISIYLRTLLAQNKKAEALDVYKKMEAMFYDELGVEFSDELHNLYKEIQDDDTPEDVPLCDVVRRWLSGSDATCVYRCAPSDFKALCQVEARSAFRSGHTTYIVRFNTKHEPNSKDVAKGSGVMKNLEQAITGCLRASDIFTRYGPNQYMVMLRSLTYEDCKMIINKIMRKVDSKYLSKIIDTSILHVTPSGEYTELGIRDN